MPGDIHNLEDAPEPHSGFLTRGTGSFDSGVDNVHHSGSSGGTRGSVRGFGLFSLSPGTNARAPARHVAGLFHHGSPPPPPPPLSKEEVQETSIHDYYETTLEKKNKTTPATGHEETPATGHEENGDEKKKKQTEKFVSMSPRSFRKSLRVTIRSPDMSPINKDGNEDESTNRITNEDLNPSKLIDVVDNNDDGSNYGLESPFPNDDDDDDYDDDDGRELSFEQDNDQGQQQEYNSQNYRATERSPYPISLRAVSEGTTRSSLYDQDDNDMYLLGLSFLGPKPAWLRNRHVSNWVVRNAPCFWCFCNPLETAATDRSILYRLNILMAFFGAIHMASAIMLSILLYGGRVADRSEVDPLNDDSVDPDFFGSLQKETTEEPASPQPTSIFSINSDGNDGNILNLWNLNSSVLTLGILGFVVLLTTSLSLRVVRQVNVFGAVRYLWALLWFLPVQCYMSIQLFDYHRVTSVFVKHMWTDPDLAWFREWFCDAGTAHTECAVPIGGAYLFVLPNETIDENTAAIGEERYCQRFYNSTDCTAIREDAQSSFEAVLYFYYTCNAIWALLTALLILLAVRLLEGIITKPIVQRSRQHNVPGWLTLPIIGCIFTGCILLWSSTSAVTTDISNENYWIGTGFMVCGGLFFTAAAVGWWISAFSILNNRDKQYKVGAVVLFIAILTITMVFLCTIFSASIVFSLSFKEKTVVGDEERGTIACAVSAGSCSFCNNRLGRPECPEWSVRDVATITRAQLKQSATIATIFIIYSFSAWRFGFLLLKHVRQYQIDYV